MALFPWMVAAAAVAGIGATWLMRRRSLYHRINSLASLDPACFAQIRTALEIIEQAFAKHKHKSLALAFNGGKDCLVVFYLVYAHCQYHGLDLPLIVYFEKDADEFPEMIHFRQTFLCDKRCALLTVSGDYKQGLQELMQGHGIGAIFMGTRRTDPHAPTQAFAMTSAGWPQVERVCPILDLDYANVWQFLKLLHLPYCCLYDEGFSSLGPRSTTSKNQELICKQSGAVLPAHVLRSSNSEREGRMV